MDSMKNVLATLFEHRKLTREEARQVLLMMTSEQEDVCNEAQMAAFVTVYLMRPIALEELQGFRDALLELCLPLDLGTHDAVDVCGTGGDGKNTFNISTLTAFVVAGAGYKVTKHGNYGVSSGCGSSNVLESLGIQFSNDNARLRQQLEQAGICFLHAPLFHPALKRIAPVRRQLAVKTFFNMLGPLVNPARPKHQLVGVFSLELARLYQYLLRDAETEFCVVHTLDGYDEVSLTGPAQLIRPGRTDLAGATDMQLPKLTPEQLAGGSTVEEASGIFTSILKGDSTEAQRAAVLANAALAIGTFHPGRRFAENLEEAAASLDSGEALKRFEALRELSAVSLN